VLGSELLRRLESTRRYADVALGHHRFYDDSRGYPEDFKTSESKDKPIIDLVMCADCMDAATDSVGRSYNRGKTLEEYTKEVKEGSGLWQKLRRKYDQEICFSNQS
jgi:response regulator RpfG family c-di-GMP phosphodiesterase